jgi:hypothetical protein
MRAQSSLESASTAVSSHLLARVLESFFPDTRMCPLRGAVGHGERDTALVADRFLEFNWSGCRYGLQRARPFTVLERVLFEAIADVVGDRLYSSRPGLLEDACVATFLAPVTGSDHERSAYLRTVASAMTVLRAAARAATDPFTTTGVIVASRSDGADNSGPASDLRAFLRLCDGVKTVGVLSRTGAIVGIRTLDQSGGSPAVDLPYPVAPCHSAAARATVNGDDLCLILDASGHIQLFSRGVHLFSWADGRWQLRDGEAAARPRALRRARR